ncbi:MAG: hypothetical protein QXW70_00895 [Candidatus Anstonellales archaeon]
MKIKNLLFISLFLVSLIFSLNRSDPCFVPDVPTKIIPILDTDNGRLSLQVVTEKRDQQGRVSYEWFSPNDSVRATIFIYHNKINSADGITQDDLIWRVETDYYGFVSLPLGERINFDSSKASTYTFVYCYGFTEPKRLAKCLYLPDRNKNPIEEINYADIAIIYGFDSSGNQMTQGSPPSCDLPDSCAGNLDSLASTYAKWSYEPPRKEFNLGVCMMVSILLSLLLGAMFMRGEDPLRFWDITTTRFSRGRAYQMRLRSKLDQTQAIVGAALQVSGATEIVKGHAVKGLKKMVGSFGDISKISEKASRVSQRAPGQQTSGGSDGGGSQPEGEGQTINGGSKIGGSKLEQRQSRPFTEWMSKPYSGSGQLITFSLLRAGVNLLRGDKKKAKDIIKDAFTSKTPTAKETLTLVFDRLWGRIQPELSAWIAMNTTGKDSGIGFMLSNLAAEVGTGVIDRETITLAANIAFLSEENIKIMEIKSENAKNELEKKGLVGAFNKAKEMLTDPARSFDVDDVINELEKDGLSKEDAILVTAIALVDIVLTAIGNQDEGIRYKKENLEKVGIALKKIDDEAKKIREEINKSLDNVNFDSILKSTEDLLKATREVVGDRYLEVLKLVKVRDQQSLEVTEKKIKSEEEQQNVREEKKEEDTIPYLIRAISILRERSEFIRQHHKEIKKWMGINLADEDTLRAVEGIDEYLPEGRQVLLGSLLLADYANLKVNEGDWKALEASFALNSALKHLVDAKKYRKRKESEAFQKELRGLLTSLFIYYHKGDSLGKATIRTEVPGEKITRRIYDFQSLFSTLDRMPLIPSTRSGLESLKMTLEKYTTGAISSDELKKSMEENRVFGSTTKALRKLGYLDRLDLANDVYDQYYFSQCSLIIARFGEPIGERVVELITEERDGKLQINLSKLEAPRLKLGKMMKVEDWEGKLKEQDYVSTKEIMADLSKLSKPKEISEEKPSKVEKTEKRVSTLNLISVYLSLLNAYKSRLETEKQVKALEKRIMRLERLAGTVRLENQPSLQEKISSAKNTYNIIKSGFEKAGDYAKILEVKKGELLGFLHREFSSEEEYNKSLEDVVKTTRNSELYCSIYQQIIDIIEIANVSYRDGRCTIDGKNAIKLVENGIMPANIGILNTSEEIIKAESLLGHPPRLTLLSFIDEAILRSFSTSPPTTGDIFRNILASIEGTMPVAWAKVLLTRRMTKEEEMELGSSYSLFFNGLLNLKEGIEDGKWDYELMDNYKKMRSKILFAKELYREGIELSKRSGISQEAIRDAFGSFDKMAMSNINVADEGVKEELRKLILSYNIYYPNPPETLEGAEEELKEKTIEYLKTGKSEEYANYIKSYENYESLLPK